MKTYKQTKPREIYFQKCEAYYVVGVSNCKVEGCPVERYLKRKSNERDQQK